VRAVGPHPFEAVERALFGVEHVHHERAVVEQHPLERVETLDAERSRSARVGDLLLDVVDDRLHLPGVGAVRDHEVVGHDQYISDVDQHRVDAELVVSGPRGELCPLAVGGGGSAQGVLPGQGT
jgi:hypothetical protein